MGCPRYSQFNQEQERAGEREDGDCVMMLGQLSAGSSGVQMAAGDCAGTSEDRLVRSDQREASGSRGANS